jgi:hypothetical protein
MKKFSPPSWKKYANNWSRGNEYNGWIWQIAALIMTSVHKLPSAQSRFQYTIPPESNDN